MLFEGGVGALPKVLEASMGEVGLPTNFAHGNGMAYMGVDPWGQSCQVCFTLL